MKILLSITILTAGFLFMAVDQQPNTANLIVEFVNFENDKGQARIALCNSEENYKDDKTPFRGANTGIKNGNAVFIFENIPFGEYAVKVFHDENMNLKLDTNWMGIPKEAFGFSNDAKGRFGPPPFEKAKFNVDKNEIRITITLNKL